jgi:hypothetical protein
LIFDNYLITDLKNKFRDQEIEITLFLPIGTLLKVDESVANYDRTDDDFFYWHPEDSSKNVFRVDDNKIKCLNCPEDENDENDENNNDDNQSNITINENGVTIESDSVVKTKKNFKELKINKDGIIIKTE